MESHSVSICWHNSSTAGRDAASFAEKASRSQIETTIDIALSSLKPVALASRPEAVCRCARPACNGARHLGLFESEKVSSPSLELFYVP